MIQIKDKEDCCGCQVCGDICPPKAISFKIDEEGIWYPDVNNEACVDCHLCEKVCPILNAVSNQDNCTDPITYILQAPNTIDRLKSASGGAYTLLVQEVFKRGGYVAGHIWNDKASVKGYISCKQEDLDILRGTKYLQSDVEGLYKKVKSLLQEGKFVLFSGSPCQIAAMRSFLKNEYENLLMADFVCMGIDSPWAFRKYIESLENQFNSKMVFFKAKSKEVGWRYLTNKAVFENKKSYLGINDVDANLKATFMNVLVRPSCYECKFKGFPRISDMTIGDYWRKTITDDPLDDNTGTSYIMLHNDKAIRFFESIKNKCHYRSSSITEILGANRHAIKSLSRPVFSREEFYNRLKTEDFTKLVDEYYYNTKQKTSFFKIIKRYIRFIVLGAYYNKKSPLSYMRMIYYNIFSSQVQSNIKNGDILIVKNVKFKLGKNAKVIINGHCIIDGQRGLTLIRLADNAELCLNSNLIESNVDIYVHSESNLCVGFKTIIGNHVNINVVSDIAIGDFCFIDRDVVIDSTESGIVYFNGEDIFNKSVSLGTHVLLCQGCKVYGGTKIGDESIVREYSIVKGNVPAQSVLSGVPAIVIDNNINWKHNFDFVWNYRN